MLVSEYLKAALDPKVKVRVEGVVLTSPAIGVQPSHPIVAVSMFLALEIKKSQTEVLDCIILKSPTDWLQCMLTPLWLLVQ